MPLPIERSQGNVASLVSRFQIAANRDKAHAQRRPSSGFGSHPPERVGSSTGRRLSGWGEPGGVILPSEEPLVVPDSEFAVDVEPAVVEAKRVVEAEFAPEPAPASQAVTASASAAEGVAEIKREEHETVLVTRAVPSAAAYEKEEKDKATIEDKAPTRPRVLKPAIKGTANNHHNEAKENTTPTENHALHSSASKPDRKPLLRAKPSPSRQPPALPAPPRVLKPKQSMPKLKSSYTGPSEDPPSHSTPRRPASTQPLPTHRTGGSAAPLPAQKTGGSAGSRGSRASIGSNGSPVRPTASSLAKMRPRASLGSGTASTSTPPVRAPRHSMPAMPLSSSTPKSPPSAPSASTSRLMRGTAASRARAAAVAATYSPTQTPTRSSRSLASPNKVSPLKASTSSRGSASRGPPHEPKLAHPTITCSPPSVSSEHSAEGLGRRLPAAVGRSPMGRIGLAGAREAPKPDEVATAEKESGVVNAVKEEEDDEPVEKEKAKKEKDERDKDDENHGKEKEEEEEESAEDADEKPVSE